MLRITVGNNMQRNTVMVDSNTTLRQVLTEAGIDYATGAGMTTLDGTPLQPGDLDKTFDSFGITESAYLLRVTKTDNA